MKSILSMALVASAVAISAPASAVSLSATLSGNVTTSTFFPEPGQQQITLSGGFTSYTASADLPQITQGDFAAYTFTVSGVVSSFNNATNTATYDLTSGTINAYGSLIQTLAPTQLTVAFSPDGSTGVINGTLVSAGPTPRPAGFPGTGPIDFTPANGATIVGVYTRTGPGSNGTFTAAINAVPEPATWAMMISGFGLVGAASRRRARTSVTFA
jgi:hypothetical protein